MATITIRLDENEKEALQEYAKKHDLSVSHVVRKAIKDLLFADKAVEILNKIPN